MAQDEPILESAARRHEARPEDKTVSGRLAKVLDFEPGKANITSTAFQIALKNVRDRRQKVAEQRGEELLEKAINLQESFSKIKSDFLKQEAKFNKELGKVISTIERLMKGDESPDEEPAQDGEKVA